LTDPEGVVLLNGKNRNSRAWNSAKLNFFRFVLILIRIQIIEGLKLNIRLNNLDNIVQLFCLYCFLFNLCLCDGMYCRWAYCVWIMHAFIIIDFMHLISRVFSNLLCLSYFLLLTSLKFLFQYSAWLSGDWHFRMGRILSILDSIQ